MRIWLLCGLAACAAPAGADPTAWFECTGERAFAVVTVSKSGALAWLVVGGRPAERGMAALYGGDGECLASRELGDDVAYAVDVAAAGTSAAVVMATGDVLVLSLPDLVPVRRWRHGRPAVAVAFSPDGSWLASGGFDGVVLVGPNDDTTPTTLEHGAPVTCLCFSPDGTRIAAGTRDGKVRLHERTGRLLRTWNRLGGEVVEVIWRDGQVHCRVRTTAIAEPEARVLAWP